LGAIFKKRIAIYFHRKGRKMRPKGEIPPNLVALFVGFKHIRKNVDPFVTVDINP
jgi:hypothetical protein